MKFSEYLKTEDFKSCSTEHLKEWYLSQYDKKSKKDCKNNILLDYDFIPEIGKAKSFINRSLTKRETKIIKKEFISSVLNKIKWYDDIARSY